MKLADSLQDAFGTVAPPPQLKTLTDQSGAGGINIFLGKAITLLYEVAAVIVVFMVIFSAFQMITSGGEKEAVSKARNRLTYAIVGIVLLAFSFLILRVLGSILGFTLFGAKS